MFRRIRNVAVFALALGLAAFGLSMVASESGEVVVLHTRDTSGADHETRVWVVDDGGQQWVRAGQPGSSWLVRIRANPSIEMERQGHRAAYTAVPEVAERDRLNALFAEKYGWADAYIGALFGHGKATPIRLDPRS
jgi:hypothetical protein